MLSISKRNAMAWVRYWWGSYIYIDWVYNDKYKPGHGFFLHLVKENKDGSFTTRHIIDTERN